MSVVSEFETILTGKGGIVALSIAKNCKLYSVLSLDELSLKCLEDKKSISPTNAVESGNSTFSAGIEFLIDIEKLNTSPTVKESTGPLTDIFCANAVVEVKQKQAKRITKFLENKYRSILIIKDNFVLIFFDEYKIMILI